MSMHKLNMLDKTFLGGLLLISITLVGCDDIDSNSSNRNRSTPPTPESQISTNRNRSTPPASESQISNTVNKKELKENTIRAWNEFAGIYNHFINNDTSDPEKASLALKQYAREIQSIDTSHIDPKLKTHIHNYWSFFTDTFQAIDTYESEMDAVTVDVGIASTFGCGDEVSSNETNNLLDFVAQCTWGAIKEGGGTTLSNTGEIIATENRFKSEINQLSIINENLKIETQEISSYISNRYEA